MLVVCLFTHLFIFQCFWVWRCVELCLPLKSLGSFEGSCEVLHCHWANLICLAAGGRALAIEHLASLLVGQECAGLGWMRVEICRVFRNRPRLHVKAPASAGKEKCAALIRPASLSLSCVWEYYCTEGLLLYKRGPSPLTFSVQTFRGVFKTSVTTLTNPKWYFIVVQLIH